MLSIAIAAIVVGLIIFAIKWVARISKSGSSIQDVFEKMYNMLQDEEIQNEGLDERLRAMLSENDSHRKLTQFYGLSPDDPIRVNGPIGEQLYIAMLRGLDGQAVIGHRLGSIGRLDAYEIATTDFSQWAVLFFDMYYLSKDTAAPDCFVLDGSGARTLTSVNRFMVNFPSNFYGELIEAVRAQVGFPLVNVSLRDIQSEGVRRPVDHAGLMNQIIVQKRAEGIGMDS
jgi:hypothetical protein